MNFTDQEKLEIKAIFLERGFTYFAKGIYNFSDGSNPKKLVTFLKQLGSPHCFQNRAQALYVQLQLHKALGPMQKEFEVIVSEFSKENIPEGAINTLNSVDVSSESEEAEDPNSYILSLVPVVNITNNARDQIILLDPHRDYRPALEINPEIFMTLQGTDSFKLIADPKVLKALTVFDPYTLKSLFIKESSKGAIRTWHVNYYVPPRWRFVNAEPAFKGFIKDLFDHLFPNQNEKEYVLDWLHYAITSRNDTMLCLIGPRGTGKGVLLKDIMSQLIGLDYREIVNQEILTDKFNGAFKNRRYIFFDEVNISGERELNKVKAFCNSTIVVEEKGQDSETIDNYTSLALSSNDKKDFRAEPQERRFSVPEITDMPLLDVKTEAEIDGFVNEIANPESVLLAEFGNFLIQRKPKNTSRKPLKGKYFFQLSRLSMPEWKSYIIEYIVHEGVSGEYILVSSLVKKFKKIHGDNAPFATKRGSIETFLGDYFHEGDCKVGRVVDAWDPQRSRDTFAIIPDDSFLTRYGANKPKVAGSDSSDDALDAL